MRVNNSGRRLMEARRLEGKEIWKGQVGEDGRWRSGKRCGVRADAHGGKVEQTRE